MAILKNIPIKESDNRKPINPYAQTKLEDEYLAKKYSEMGAQSYRSSIFQRVWEEAIKGICWSDQTFFGKN